jgi:hypothetical protein
MQFEVNNQEYILTFEENENCFYVVSPTEDGMYRIPVYVDVAKWERAGKTEKRKPRRVQ